MDDKDLTWRKSRRSDNGGNCVQVSQRHGLMIRDSKLGDASPVLVFSADAWRRLTNRIKSGLSI
jgi:hypothetical protein